MKRLAFAWLVGAALLLGGAAPVRQGPVDLARLQAETPAPTLDVYRLFKDAGGRTPNTGLTPYALNSPLFSDYADKHRLVYLPPGKQVLYREKGALEFPVGTTLVKTFAYPADFRRPNEAVRYIETRLLIRRAKGWVPLTYVWNAEQTEAVLKRAGARVNVAFLDKAGAKVAFSYKVPNLNECKECHSVADALVPVGPKARNLNGAFAYAEGPENQLAHWTRTGMLKGAPDPASITATPRWDDPALPVRDRALAYLDANCAHCHNPDALANNSGLFLEYEQTDPVARGIGRRPVAAGRGSDNLDFDVVPGAPEKSIMLSRMASTDPGAMMPELSRSLIDAEGLALIRAYVAGLEP